MSATSTDTAVYRPHGHESLSSSFHLGSSIASLSPSRPGNSQISRTYKQARDLFLTRRLPEAYSTLEPLITVPPASEDDPDDEVVPKYAPVARASQSQRVKIWSLYLTLTNAIHELGAEEGKSTFGIKQWRQLTSKAWDGSIWEEVIQSGYGGVEGSVDADVIINLATLLLAQSPSQSINQQRLETYLSASNQPNAGEQTHSSNGVNSPLNGTTHNKGMNTPRDLASRVKILEIYALHVLPRNEEWDYARDFVKMSDILDEETRETFLQNLNDLEEQKNGPKPDQQGWTQHDSADEQHEQELRQIEPRHEEDEPNIHENQDNADDSEATLKATPRSPHRRTHSEHDYGIETPKAPAPPSQASLKPPGRPPQPRTMHSPPTTSRKKNPSSPPGLYGRSTTILLNFQHLITSMTQSLSRNPMALLRFVLFVLGLVVALSRRDVKDRIAKGWDKVRQTIGMGVKVSYI